MNRRTFLKTAAGFSLAAPLLLRDSFAAVPPPTGLAFGGEQFSSLVADSLRVAPVVGSPRFETWWRDRYATDPAAQSAFGAGSFETMLERTTRTLQQERDPQRRAMLELEFAKKLHRLVKNLIPRFSLQRGFEFTLTVSRLERQCLLQSTLIAGMLERCGVRAGVVMVWRNQLLAVSNLGHAVTLLKLADGRDALIDASDPTPLMRHSGLLGWDAARRDYRFVAPRFALDDTIQGYTRIGDTSPLTTAGFEPLGFAYLRSQFYFYRGERVTGGFMGSPPTRVGLEASAAFLETAERTETRNPLAVYVLGHVYRRLERMPEARARYERAHALYVRFGFVPNGMADAYKRWVRGA